MALRVKCRCGKSLKISSKLADKKLVCPDCARPFRIPAEKFGAAAAKRKRPARPTAAPSAVPQPVELGIQPVELDIQPANPDAAIQPADLDVPGEFEHSQSDLRIDLESAATGGAAAGSPPVAVPVEGVRPAALGYATEPGKERLRGYNVAGDTIQGPKRGFWSDAFGAFIYPVMNKDNIATFVTITLVVAFPTLMTFLMSFVGGLAGVLMLPLVVLAIFFSLLIFVWLYALYLSVIAETAAGSDDLPGFSMSNGLIEDVLRPAFKFFGACVIVFLPGILLSLFIAFGLAPESLHPFVPVCLVVGAFFVPISLLLFSFSAQNMLLRPDLIFRTIIRTLLPYLAIWLMLLLVLLVRLVATSPAFLARIGLASIAPNLAGLGPFGSLILELIDVYLAIVAMRVIGLYYLHFKKRFAIVME